MGYIQCFCCNHTTKEVKSYKLAKRRQRTSSPTTSNYSKHPVLETTTDIEIQLLQPMYTSHRYWVMIFTVQLNVGANINVRDSHFSV